MDSDSQLAPQRPAQVARKKRSDTVVQRARSAGLIPGLIRLVSFSQHCRAVQRNHIPDNAYRIWSPSRSQNHSRGKAYFPLKNMTNKWQQLDDDGYAVLPDLIGPPLHRPRTQNCTKLCTPLRIRVKSPSGKCVTPRHLRHLPKCKRCLPGWPISAVSPPSRRSSKPGSWNDLAEVG